MYEGAAHIFTPDLIGNLFSIPLTVTIQFVFEHLSDNRHLWLNLWLTKTSNIVFEVSTSLETKIEAGLGKHDN